MAQGHIMGNIEASAETLEVALDVQRKLALNFNLYSNSIYLSNSIPTNGKYPTIFAPHLHLAISLVSDCL